MNSSATIGMDLGDRKHEVCILDTNGEVTARERITNTATAVRKFFSKLPPALVALEAGTHSAWISRVLQECGHEVLVGHPRKIRAIWDTDLKNDRTDAEILARIARLDPQLLNPITHRGLKAQEDLAVIKARDAMVRARSALINHVRGSVKAVGERISACSSEAFAARANDELPSGLRAAMMHIIRTIEEQTATIRTYDKQIEAMCAKKYPETARLRGIAGVGPITALAFVLTLEDAGRFESARAVGAFLGMTPRIDESGKTRKQLHITRAGNVYLRRLLVGCAQYILGPFGPECDLRRFGLKIAERGGKNSKRRAVVAVARKLSVVMYRLWQSGDEYNPELHQKSKAA